MREKKEEKLEGKKIGRPVLSEDEQKTLHSLEAVIASHDSYFFEVGKALRQIKDDELYRGRFKTIEAYSKTVWDFVASRVRQLIAATEVMEKLMSNITPDTDGIVVLPKCERHVRPLIALEPEHQVGVWKRAVKMAAKERVTAKDVEAAVKWFRRFKPGKRPPTRKFSETFDRGTDMDKEFERFMSELRSRYGKGSITSLQVIATANLY